MQPMKYFVLIYVLRTILFVNVILCAELNSVLVTLENLQSKQTKQENVIQCLKSKLDGIKLREDYNEQSNDLQLNTSEISEKKSVKKIVNNEDSASKNSFAANEEENDSLNVEVDSDSYDKSSFIRDQEDEDTLETQEKNNVQSTSLEIATSFKLLESELSEISNFYFHYDVFIIIEKCIALINKFQSSFNFNGKNNAMFLRISIKNINRLIENYGKLFFEVKQIYLKKKEDKLNSSDFDYIWDGLINLDYHTNFLKEDFDRYKNFDLENYKSFNEIKCKKLTNLRDYLIKIKNLMNLMKEDEIKEYANSFKDKYIKIINEIHEELFKYNEKEKGSLTFLFDFMNKIWRSYGKCFDDLESFKRDLSEK